MSKEICRPVHTASGYCGLKIHPGGQDWSSSSYLNNCVKIQISRSSLGAQRSPEDSTAPQCAGEDMEAIIFFTKDTHFQMKPWPTFSSASLTPIPPSQWPTLRPPRYSYYCFFVPGTIFPLNRWWSQWMNMNRSTHEWLMYTFSLNLQNVLGNEFFLRIFQSRGRIDQYWSILIFHFTSGHIMSQTRMLMINDQLKCEICRQTKRYFCWWPL